MNGADILRILITGINGFVGRHLASLLQDHELHGTVFNSSPTDSHIHYHHLDLRDEDAAHQLINEVRPQQIYHLAAQSFVPRSFNAPWETLENNIRAQVNLFEACRKIELYPRVLIVSSAVVYGVVGPHEVPIPENAPLRPNNPYGVSKVAQDMLAFQYHATYNWHIIRARAFNHIGIGQGANFVAPAFAMQIARIEANLQEPVLRVGDLSAKRDFSDVRDVVCAYQLLMEKGTAGTVYNVATGTSHSIQYLLDQLIALSTHNNIRIEVDQKALRPSNIPVLEGDPTLLKQATEWQPEFTFEQTLADVLEDCRRRVRENRT